MTSLAYCGWRLKVKQALRNGVAIGVLSAGGIALPGTYSVPHEAPILSVKLPQDWRVQEHDEFIEGTEPEGAIHLLVLPVETTKVAESLGEGIRYIRNTGGIVIKTAQPKQERTQRKGKPVQSLSWSGRDRKGEITLQCHVVSGKEGKQALIFFWGSPEAEKKHRTALNTILETLAAPP
jgi:hypothetical protein